MLKFFCGLLLGAIVGATVVLRLHPSSHPTPATSVRGAGAPLSTEPEVLRTAQTVATGHSSTLTLLMTAPYAVRCGWPNEDTRTPVVLSLRRVMSPSESRLWALKCGDAANMKAVHQRFEGEKRDAEWADATEAHLNSGLNKDAAFLRLSVGSIQCHSTICEFRASGPEDMDTKIWDGIVSRLSSETWWTFKSGTFAAVEQNGRSEMLAVLRRPEPVFQLH